MDARPPAALVSGEVIGTVNLPDERTKTPSGRFLTVWEEDEPLLMEKSTGRGLHYFLGHLASRVDPVPRFESLTLIGTNQGETVRLLYSLFYVQVGL